MNAFAKENSLIYGRMQRKCKLNIINFRVWQVTVIFLMIGSG